MFSKHKKIKKYEGGGHPLQKDENNALEGDKGPPANRILNSFWGYRRSPANKIKRSLFRQCLVIGGGHLVFRFCFFFAGGLQVRFFFFAGGGGG